MRTAPFTANPQPEAPTARDDAAVIGLVGLAHAVSHFSQLLLAPLFPWLKEAFAVSYAQLGFLLTVFFVVSCAVQALSGFWVDRYGPRPVLMCGLALLGSAALGFAASTSYAMLAAFSVLAGIGNGVFHPVDYTLLNRRVSAARLGHAYSVHGITGNLGWALAPALLVPLTLAWSWRVALLAAAALAFTVLLVLVWQRQRLRVPPVMRPAAAGGAAPEGRLDFLRIPAVWMCMGFFFCYACVLSVVQSFAPEAARQLHDVPAALVALCLTTYMLCSAAGMVLGGFLASGPPASQGGQRSERIVAACFTTAAALALAMALLPIPGTLVPLVFGLIGFCTGVSGPSRDLLVKRSTPDNASGRVYGVVYGGLDIGQALMPLLVGRLMDLHHYQAVWLVLALMQGTLIATAFRVRQARRTTREAATASA